MKRLTWEKLEEEPVKVTDDATCAISSVEGWRWGEKEGKSKRQVILMTL